MSRAPRAVVAILTRYMPSRNNGTWRVGTLIAVLVVTSWQALLLLLQKKSLVTAGSVRRLHRIPSVFFCLTRYTQWFSHRVAIPLVGTRTTYTGLTISFQAMLPVVRAPLGLAGVVLAGAAYVHLRSVGVNLREDSGRPG